MTCCERLHTSANIAQQETTLLGPTMLRVVASVCTGLKSREKQENMVMQNLVGQTKSIIFSDSANSRFLHEVTAAMLEPLNEETAAMLEPRPNPPGIQRIIMQTFSFVFVEKHGC